MMPASAEGVRILAGARVHTQSSFQGSALAFRDAQIVAVADLEQLRSAFPAAEVLDYPGATITPGLTDAHIHLTEWAVARQELDLRAARTPEQVVAIIRTAGRATRGEWLLGRGWNPHHWGGEYPDRALLDAALPDRPAAFQSHDMHALWVNSRALELAGIDAGTPDPEGGRIERDSDGRPTGMLLETAAQLVVSRIPDPADEAALAAVLDAQRQLHAYGITGIHSFPGVHLIEPQPLRILQRLRERGELRLRVLQHIALDQLDEAIHLGLRSGFGDAWFRVGGVKMFLDGALGSRTAWMRAPYEHSRQCGLQVLPERDFRELASRAAQAGIACTVHAIGDAAVTLAFDVLAAPAAQAGTLPNRIEHVQCCPPDRYALAAQAGIICSMQPCHLISDWRAADRHWGRDRAATTYAFAALRDHGAILAFGSDAPVEPCDPRLGFHAATLRQDLARQPPGGWFPEQGLDLADVLRAYTLGPAMAAGTAATSGHLSPAAAADFVVWEQDPLETEAADLLQLRVRATFVGGQLVHHV